MGLLLIAELQGHLYLMVLELKMFRNEVRLWDN
jgi:hypothetical protein